MKDSSISPSLRLRRLLGHFFSNNDNICLVTTQSRSLLTKSCYLTDLSTLPDSVALVEKWLPLAPAQMALFNDRSLSGTLLASLTLVYRLPQDSVIATPIYLCQRHYFVPRGLFAEDSGQNLVIPPTPIADRAKPLDGVITAIAHHPLAFTELKQNLAAYVQTLIIRAQRFISLCETLALRIDEGLVREYFREESRVVEEALSHLPEGRTSIQFAPVAKQQICLEVEFARGQLKLDFTGTSNSPFAVTAQQTFAASLGTLNRLLLGREMLIAGLSQHLAVVAPKNTFVNGGELANPLNWIEGTSWVAHATAQAMSQYSPQFQAAQHGLTNCPVLLHRPDGESQLLISPVGMGGSSVYRGRNAVYIWNDPGHHALPIHNDPSADCLSLASYHLRRNSGGKGRLGGGNGLVQSYKVTQPCRIEWFYTDERAKGSEGGKAGSAAEVQIKKAGQTWETLPSQGDTQLVTGDELAILSPGGGGFGVPPNT